MNHKNNKRARGKHRLSTAFIEALAKDFEEHGEGVIRICRAERPLEYLKIYATIVSRMMANEAMEEMPPVATFRWLLPGEDAHPPISLDNDGLTVVLAGDRCIGFILSARPRGVRALDHAGQELGYFATQAEGAVAIYRGLPAGE
jgi:hypothetical protein